MTPDDAAGERLTEKRALKKLLSAPTPSGGAWLKKMAFDKSAGSSAIHPGISFAIHRP